MISCLVDKILAVQISILPQDDSFVNLDEESTEQFHHKRAPVARTMAGWMAEGNIAGIDNTDTQPASAINLHFSPVRTVACCCQ